VALTPEPGILPGNLLLHFGADNVAVVEEQPQRFRSVIGSPQRAAMADAVDQHWGIEFDLAVGAGYSHLLRGQQ
jgi:hypothetical protein